MRGIVRRSSDQSRGNLVHWWKQLCLQWKKKRERERERAVYAVVSSFETIEAKPLPPGTSVQLAELITLTWALELGKGKWVALYTDSKYAFLVLHVHAAIWKERGYLTTRGSPIKYSDQILRLLEGVHLTPELSVSHCKGYQKGSRQKLVNSFYATTHFQEKAYQRLLESPSEEQASKRL